MEDRMSEVGINERVARMIGWDEQQSRGVHDETWKHDFWVTPDREERQDLPDFEHSLDAAREVLAWVKSQDLQTQLVDELYGHLSMLRSVPWKALNAEPQD